MTTLLECIDVRRVYDDGNRTVAALAGVSLRVAAGEFVGITGPSGSGKTTLLSLMGGMDRVTSGEVCLDGLALSKLRAADLARMRRRFVGYVFQEFNLVPELTAVENVALPMELDGQSRKSARAAALEALGEVALADLGSSFPDELSGGQRQRVAIARAVVGHRKLVLADEPTGALDTATADQVVTVLRDLASAGAGIVMVTHELRFVPVFDRVVALRDGLIDTSAANLGPTPSDDFEPV